MIDLYTWNTPNGRKVSIMLEELGVPYEVKPVNIGDNEQFRAEFLKISPNNKVPAIVDHESGVALGRAAAAFPLVLLETALVVWRVDIAMLASGLVNRGAVT